MTMFDPQKSNWNVFLIWGVNGGYQRIAGASPRLWKSFCWSCIFLFFESIPGDPPTSRQGPLEPEKPIGLSLQIISLFFCGVELAYLFRSEPYPSSVCEVKQLSFDLGVLGFPRRSANPFKSAQSQMKAGLPRTHCNRVWGNLLSSDLGVFGLPKRIKNPFKSAQAFPKEMQLCFFDYSNFFFWVPAVKRSTV